MLLPLLVTIFCLSGGECFPEGDGTIKLDHELAQSCAVVLSHSGPEPGAGSQESAR